MTDPAATPTQQTRRPGAGTIIIVILVIGGAAVLWHKVVREQIFPRNFGVVAAGRIYRSAQLNERTLPKVVREHGIRTIIALNGESPESAWEQEAADELGVRRIEYSLPGDGTGPPLAYAEVLRLVTDPEMQPVLVHCAAGAERTGTVFVLYRHLIDAVPIPEAYAEASDYKHDPDDVVLLEYVNENIDEIKDAFERADATPAGTAPPG